MRRTGAAVDDHEQRTAHIPRQTALQTTFRSAFRTAVRIRQRAQEVIHLLIIRVQQRPVTGRHNGIRMAQLDELLIERKHGIGIIHLRLGIDDIVVGVHADPRFGRRVFRRETRVFRGIPLHRRACVVARLGGETGHHVIARLDLGLFDALMIHVDGLQVAVLVKARETSVRHAQLLALVNVRRAAVQVRQQCERLGRPDSHGVARRIAPAAHDARLVVVVKEYARPAVAGNGVLLRRHRALEVGETHGLGGPFAALAVVNVEVSEHKQHVKLAVARIGDVFVAGAALDTGAFTHGHIAIAAIEHLAMHLLEEFVKARTVLAEPIHVRVTLRTDLAVLHLAIGTQMLGNKRDHVHAETVNTAIHPPIHHVVHRATHGRIFPIEVRLLLRELVQVVFAALGIVLPCAAAEVGSPVVGLSAGRARLMARLGRTPPIPVRVRIVLAAAGLEPWVFVRRVVDHEVHDDLHAQPVRLGEQCVHVSESAEHRVDLLVVGDVVAVVVLRGLVDGAEPDDIDAQARQIVEALGDAAQVADSVAVRVLE